MDKPIKKKDLISVAAKTDNTEIVSLTIEKSFPKGNIGLWYYRTFFSELYKTDTPDYTSKIEPIKKIFTEWLKEHYYPALKTKWQSYSNTQGTSQLSIDTDSSFPLTTIYPGLICGIGYEHELGFENEFKLGFAFDHTSGLPYIPGSSVKGTLRSAFMHYDYMKSIFENWNNNATECPAELKDNIDEICKNLEHISWEKLEKHIFDGIQYRKDKKLKTETILSAYKRDLFFDAFISNTSKANNGLFLADDYITCHQNSKHPEMSPFTNPNPVRFLKVRSDVTFTFGFQLQDTEIETGLVFSKVMKRELFKQILLDLGIGAKTNVGYGQFKDFVEKEVAVTESTQQTA